MISCEECGHTSRTCKIVKDAILCENCGKDSGLRIDFQGE